MISFPLEISRFFRLLGRLGSFFSNWLSLLLASLGFGFAWTGVLHNFPDLLFGLLQNGGSLWLFFWHIEFSRSFQISFDELLVRIFQFDRAIN